MKRINILFASLILLFFSTTSNAQVAEDAIRIVQDEIGFGVRALGMGGAYTAVSNDYSAIYWNPAGLASLRHAEFSGEFSNLNFNNNATFANSFTGRSQNFSRLRSVGAALPIPTTRGSMVFAVGYNRVKDFDRTLIFSGFNTLSNGLEFQFQDQNGNDVIYPFDRNVSQSEQINDDGGLNQISFAGAVSLSRNFDAGVTVNVYDGSDDYQFSFNQTDVQNQYSVFPADFDSYSLNQNLKSDYSGVGVKLGGMFRVARGIRLGASVGLPVTFTVKETYSSDDVLRFDDGTEDAAILDQGNFEYKVQTPLHFDAGASLSNGFLTFAGSIRYRDWSQTKFKISDGELTDPNFSGLFEENQFIKQNYRATLQYNLGGEIYLEGMKTFLRGGYAVIPSPLQNADSNLDKKFVSGGIGFRVDRNVVLDVGYLRGTWKQNSEDSYTPGGTFEDITTQKILVGLRYQF